VRRKHLKGFSILLIVSMLSVIFSTSAFASIESKKDILEGGAIKSQKTITADDPLIAQFKADITIPDGNELNLDTAQLFEYEGASFQNLVFTTIDSKKQYGAIYDPEKRAFKDYFYEVCLTYDPEDIEKTLNGTFGFYDKSGNIIVLATYEDGKKSSITKNKGDVSIQTDWDCFADCMEGYFDQLPEWLKWICRASCPACIGGNLTLCSVCAGCLIGYGYYYCSDQCP